MSESRHALIIANDTYEDQGLKQLRAPGHDADALSGVLRNPQIGDFEVDVLRNASGQAMRKRIEGFFKDRRRDDTLVLHFSCHGIKNESGELYFAASDTEHRLLEATGVSADFVRRCMSRTMAGRTALFLDCCYGGAFSKGASMKAASHDMNVLDHFAGEKPSGGRGWAVITASNSMEFAFEGDELTEGSTALPSLFTHAVVEGLASGDADLDHDGEIYLDELYDYIHEHVQDRNPNQTPSKTVQMQGRMQVAHSRHHPVVLEPTPIPPRVQDALRRRDEFARRGAVRDLHVRMRSENLSIAEGARQALEAVVREDTGQVADEALSALQDARLKPSPARLDFGRVPRGADVPQQTVTLQGIPLARHCAAQATGKWLRVEESSDGLTVGVDTSAEGRLAGDIMLKGVADDAVVHVEAEVVPPPDEPRDTEPLDSGQKGPRVTRRPASRPLRAPALAAAALAVAVTSVVMLIVAVVKAVEASIDRGNEGPNGSDFHDFANQYGLFRPLIASLIAAVAALALGALARHELRSRLRRYSQGAKSATRAMVSVARLCAVPTVVLAAIMAIAYPITNHLW